MLCLVGMTLVLALVSANLITKLVFELELSVFLDTLELHAFKRAVVLVCCELGFKELGDSLKGLGLEFPTRHDDLVVVVLVEGHVEPLEC
jgi:hypothetical protein